MDKDSCYPDYINRTIVFIFMQKVDSKPGFIAFGLNLELLYLSYSVLEGLYFKNFSLWWCIFWCRGPRSESKGSGVEIFYQKEKWGTSHKLSLE